MIYTYPQARQLLASYEPHVANLLRGKCNLELSEGERMAVGSFQRAHIDKEVLEKIKIIVQRMQTAENVARPSQTCPAKLISSLKVAKVATVTAIGWALTVCYWMPLNILAAVRRSNVDNLIG